MGNEQLNRWGKLRPRDTQRSKVYTLRTGGDGGVVTLTEADALVAGAFSRYGLSWRGKIADGRGRRSACWHQGRNRISLPLNLRNRDTVLHEAAHGIIENLFPKDDVAWHGPEFARVMLELWAWAKLDTMPKLREQARKAGVKVSGPKVSPPQVGATKALDAARAKVKRLAAELAEARKELDVAAAKVRPEPGAVAASKRRVIRVQWSAEGEA